MEAKIAALAGSLQGNTFLLSEDETSIGREETNGIILPDSSASRRHCLIKKKGNEYSIQDLDSLNGTRVNNIPIRERTLQHQDRIEVGDSVFLFLKSEIDQAGVNVITIDSPVISARPTVRLRIEDAMYLNPEKMLSTFPLTSRMAQSLDALVKITGAIHSIRSTEALAKKLLELIFDFVPAERGALLTHRSNEGFEFVYALHRDGSNASFQVSKTIIDQVIQESSGFLSNEIQEDKALHLAQSLRTSPIRSLLAVPLLLLGKVYGVLYLDTTDSSVQFDEDHLHLMTAVAGMAAVAVQNTKHFEWLESESRRLQEEIRIEHNMIGESSAMREVYQFIARVAPVDSTVLIRGESGTGKELAAYAIHMNSSRSAAPFVVVNCAALTETLLESELFGYEKGAFTGAANQKKGKLEVADGGTVFLDEVGEISPALQSKLLRVLQQRQFDRVGGTRPVQIDVRFVAATNRDLEEAIRNGSFRQDLYYRLNVLAVTMPPLRERRDDIPLLASYFLSSYSKKSKRRVTGISPEARACLISYDWPGNVRELENAIERAVVLGNTDIVLPEDLPETILETVPLSSGRITNYHQALRQARQKIVLLALEQAQGDYKETARALGIHPNNLRRLINATVKKKKK